MTWIKLSDNFFSHPKTLKLSGTEIAVYIASLCHCSQYQTDGLIEATSVPRLLAEGHAHESAVESLLRAGMWDYSSDCDGYVVANYLEHQRSRADIEADAERKRQWRDAKKAKKQDATRTRQSRDEDATRTRHGRPLSDTEADTDTDKTTSSSPPALMEHDSPGFDAWYQHYPRKVGKGQARKTWAKLSPAHRTAALEAVPQFAAVVHRAVELATTADRKADVISGCPHPSTWLNDERWSSDLVAEVAYYGRLCGQQLEALSQTGRTKSQGIREAMGWTQPGEETQ